MVQPSVSLRCVGLGSLLQRMICFLEVTSDWDGLEDWHGPEFGRFAGIVF